MDLCDGHIQTSATSHELISVTFNKPNMLGYKLVGDNIDLAIKARYMRTDGPSNQSLHFFHLMGVRDRVNLSHLSIDLPATCLNHPERIADEILPAIDDDQVLLNNMEMIVSRVLATHMPYFKLTFSDVVTWHLNMSFMKKCF